VIFAEEILQYNIGIITAKLVRLIFAKDVENQESDEFQLKIKNNLKFYFLIIDNLILFLN
jgi:hypothetical protein